MELSMLKRPIPCLSRLVGGGPILTNPCVLDLTEKKDVSLWCFYTVEDYTPYFLSISPK